MREIKKLLIANRGEIAVRIARTCASMGIRSVAVYSDADRRAMHVRACDEAYHIGPAPASESYLRGDNVIEVAREARCDGVHPGYGFLSENAGFAQAVIDAGLVWVGPSPQAITLMGSKIESKRLAEAHGVPIVPGYFGDDQTPARLLREAEKIGYPVLIKASAGGGGKGMRVVEQPDALVEALEGAQRESQAAFGDPAVMLEKYLTRPRHIEVQVLGDLHENLIHLGERECSIQRRHQKVLEESPSPALTSELREEITGAALALARAAGYSNAGTVEFIFQDGKFYFLEMNTRLQVEHPVTEEALGLDLVELQMRLAAGEELQLKQEDVQFKAHALEARLYAEDPARGFVPATGTLIELSLPTYARVDSGLERGDVVSPYYDPMIAKIITEGESRAQAVIAMQNALGDLRLQGLTTNVAFLRWLVNHPAFEAGDLNTRFIEEHYTTGAVHDVPVEIVMNLVDAVGTGNSLDGHKLDNVWERRPWRQAGLSRPLRIELEGLEFHVEVSRGNAQQDEYVIISRNSDVLYEGPMLYNKGGFQILSRRHDTFMAASVMHGDREYVARLAPPLSTDSMNPTLHLTNEDSLESPMPGKILKLNVGAGERVEEGQALAVVEAMKMEFTVRAPHEGRVKKVNYEQGAQVAAGDVLIELTADGEKEGKR